MPPITIENLSSNPDLHPPRLVKKRGRPKTTRIRKGAWNRKQRKCSNCLQLGYNRRRCTNQPSSKNGRGERARDWVEESESNSELEKELAPFVEQARARAKAKEDSKKRGNNSIEVIDGEMTATTLQLRPVRAKQVPARYR
jgi:hypothetical protein